MFNLSNRGTRARIGNKQAEFIKKVSTSLFSRLVDDSCDSNLSTTLQKRFNAIGDRKWKEYVDKKHHRYGKDVYDTGSHHAGEADQDRYIEEYFLENVLLAREYISNTLLEVINADEYERIHTLALQHN